MNKTELIETLNKYFENQKDKIVLIGRSALLMMGTIKETEEVWISTHDKEVFDRIIAPAKEDYAFDEDHIKYFDRINVVYTNIEKGQNIDGYYIMDNPTSFIVCVANYKKFLTYTMENEDKMLKAEIDEAKDFIRSLLKRKK